MRTGLWDFSGGPVVDFAFQCGSMSSFPPQGARFPQTSQPKNMNSSNIITDSIKTSKKNSLCQKISIKRENVPKAQDGSQKPSVPYSVISFINKVKEKEQ